MSILGKRKLTADDESKKRTYKLISTEGQILGTYVGCAPRAAALKAASKGHEDIILRGPDGKVHCFQGGVRSLPPSKMTAFALEKGMTKIPWVQKIGCM